MIAFHTPVLQEQSWVEALLEQAGNECCEYSFVNLFAWSGAYDMKLAEVEGCLAVRLTRAWGPGYLYPTGRGDVRPALEALRADAAGRGEPFRLLCVPRQGVEELKRLCPDGLQAQADRASFDYLYDIHRLADLGGKRLHAKRNHIHRFEEEHPGWRTEELTADRVPECLAMAERWYAANAGGGDSLAAEHAALRRALEHCEALGLEGLLLRAEGEVVAFTAGRPMNRETCDVHFEKAFGEMHGAYAMINREFARRLRERRPEIRWLNREDDMGVEGLRRAKESYCPDRMVEKYTVTWKGL